MQEAQRQAALVIARVMEGTTLPVALAAVAPAGGDAGGRRRALVQELAYGTLRHWGELDALVRCLAKKPFSDALLGPLTAVALYQLDHTRAPAFAIVDRAVAAAAELARPAAKGVVNAMLRRYLREREALRAAVRRDPVARFSYPAWWIARIEAQYGDIAAEVLDAGNERPPLTLRVNVRAGTREALLARFAAADIAATPAGASGIVVETPRPVPGLPGYDEGAFSVQDLGAQLAAPLLVLAAGQRVLDACAAPGGKATHALELADVLLTALDSDEARLPRLEANLERLRLRGARQGSSVIVRAGDASRPADWWDGRPFDRIVADVPCTASGVIRRHPDGKWLRRETDLPAFVRTQRRIADALWPLLAPGGRLLYATCSLFAEENEEQAAAFVSRHPDALRETISFDPGVAARGGQLLPSSPGAVHNQDAFFYALFRKG
jgi:16S rRNA (cytosine967-C5)-methyltransferase